MINIKAGKIISIFSIFYGILSIVSDILGNSFLGDVVTIFRIILSIGLLVVGIITTKRLNKDLKSKGLVITLLVFYFLMIVTYLLVLTFSVVPIIMFLFETGVLMIPIISGFKYLSSLKKKPEDLHKVYKDSLLIKELYKDETSESKVVEEDNI